MITITKLLNGRIALTIGQTKLNIITKNDTIRLTKKDISRLFNIDKTEVKKILTEIKNNTQLNINENICEIFNIESKKDKIYYSLDLIINLGYRIDDFKTTKTLIKANILLKKYNTEKINPITKLLNYLDNFSIEGFFTKRYIMNL